MESVPDLMKYMSIAKSKGISEEKVRSDLIDLIGETKSYLGAMKILIAKLDIEKGEKIEKKY